MECWEVVSYFRLSNNQRVENVYLRLEKLNIKSKSQLPRTMFLEKDDSLALYDIYMEKRFVIDHEQPQFDKNSGWTLIYNPEKPDGSLLDHEYFCIHDGLPNIIQSTHQEKISCGGLYKTNQTRMNLIVNQQIFAIKISKRRRGILPKIIQAYSSEKEAENFS